MTFNVFGSNVSSDLDGEDGELTFDQFVEAFLASEINCRYCTVVSYMKFSACLTILSVSFFKFPDP
jgi:hypothetical protein